MIKFDDSTDFSRKSKRKVCTIKRSLTNLQLYYQHGNQTIHKAIDFLLLDDCVVPLHSIDRLQDIFYFKFTRKIAKKEY